MESIEKGKRIITLFKMFLPAETPAESEQIVISFIHQNPATNKNQAPTTNTILNEP